jgi:pectinesterase
MSLGSGAYTTIGVLNMQRCQMTGGWLVNMTERLSTVYVEYAVSPKTGNKFNVDSIGLTLAALSTTNLKADIFYSKDPTFATATQITYNTGLANNKISAALPQRVHVTSLGLTVNQGETLYLRIYPWVENFPVVTTGKYLCLVNVEVGGTTEPLPVSSSVIWPCSADLAGVVTGNMIAGTPTLNNLTNN